MVGKLDFASDGFATMQSKARHYVNAVQCFRTISKFRRIINRWHTGRFPFLSRLLTKILYLTDGVNDNLKRNNQMKRLCGDKCNRLKKTGDDTSDLRADMSNTILALQTYQIYYL